LRPLLQPWMYARSAARTLGGSTGWSEISVMKSAEMTGRSSWLAVRREPRRVGLWSVP
jgi:hypothetical protein